MTYTTSDPAAWSSSGGTLAPRDAPPEGRLVRDVVSELLGYDVMSIETDSDGQAWFWTETWQDREREAERDVAEGRTRTFESSEEFLRYLDE